MQETRVPSLGLEIPWRREWQPILVFLPRESQGQRSLAGYSPWGHKESDMTEATYTAQHTYKIQTTLFYDIIYGLYNIYINDLIYRFM